MRDVSEGEACPTESGFIADQDRATIAKSSTLPHDSAPRVTAPAADEGILEDRDSVAAKHSGDDAPIKRRSINEGEAAAKRISNDSEEGARVLTSMDAATVLAGGIDVPTGSGSIPTADPPAADISTDSEVASTAILIVTASPIVSSYSRRKGKEVMVDSDTPKKQKLQEQIDAQVARELEEQQEKEDIRMNKQIARDAEVARIHAEEELQGMIDSLDRSNETIAMYLQEYQDFASELPLEKRIELINDLVIYQENYSKVEDFIPMGSKEETERLKRKGLNLEKEQVKKQKSSEEAPKIETTTKELTEEKIKEMMQLVPLEDVYVQALQVKYPIIDWKVHSEDLLRQLDRDDLNQLWALVKEYLSIRPASSDKEMKLWSTSCGCQRQRDLYASRKDYPLRRGLALVMINYKLQVEDYSQMAEDLIRKIYNIANTPRKQSD
nr:hypothetical protein [Tanacetum cinerariifolium]